MKWLISVLALAAATAVLWPAAAGAATFTGIVVGKQHGTLLVASPTGSLRTVHARAALGSRLALTRSGATVIGRASHARIRGVVVRRVGTTLVLYTWSPTASSDPTAGNVADALKRLGIGFSIPR